MTSTLPLLPQPGDLVAGKYRIERMIGKGGMGVVYAAQHELLGQRVALKLLLAPGPQHAEASARFLQEARAAARIQHENIARVSDVGALENGTPYMVMEFLEGRDLSAVLQTNGPLEPWAAVDYVLQALEAVAQAHAVGIVHRDLKPANLFLAQKVDGSSLVKVLDFGISKTSDPLTSGAQTSTQSMLGSPYYMSPEQLRSSKNVDRRTDIWSMGIILYELLTGTLPFQADTLGGLFAAILEETPMSIRQRRSDVPAELEAVVWRCLSRNPDQRIRDAAELAEELAPFASPNGLGSVDRVLAITASAGQRGSLPEGVGGGPGGRGSTTGRGTTGRRTTGRGRTAASWQTTSDASKGAGKKIALGAVAALALATVVGVTVWRCTPRPIAAAAATSGTEAPASALASGAASAPPEAAASSASADVPAASAEPAAGSASAAPSAAPAAASASASASATRPARAAPRPAAHAKPAPTYDPTKDSRL